MAETYENKQRLPVWRRMLLALVLAAMVVVGGVMLAAYLASRQLGREVVKIREAGEPVTFSALNPAPIQKKAVEDANRYYIESVRQILPDELTNLIQVNTFCRINLVSLPANQFPADLCKKAVENLVKAEPIFAKLDKGARLPLSGFDIGVLRGRQICKSQLDSVQGTVLLSSLRTLDLIRRGDSEKATESILTTLKLIRVFDSHPTIIVQGRKMICVRLVCSDIQLLLLRCRPSEQHLEMLQSMLEESFPADSLERTLLAERIYQLEIARDLIPRHISSKYLTAEVSKLPERLSLPAFTWHRMRVFRLSAQFMRDIAWFIEVSRSPWPEPLNKIKDGGSTPSRVASGLTSAVTLLTRLAAETFIATRCTVTAVAIERYRREEKKLPDRLEDMCPRYIKSIPQDPLTGLAILYTHGDKSYKVYSAASIHSEDVNSVMPLPDRPVILDDSIRRPSTSR
jgi:hypothetical protein